MSFAESGMEREEALWFAGEAWLQRIYCTCVFDKPECEVAHSIDLDINDLNLPNRSFFKSLLEEFPDSPLRPFAQLRLAACQRRSHVVANGNPRNDKPFEPILAELNKVEAPEGSYAWAWKHLYSGVFHAFIGDQLPDAREHFQLVADAMPPGPERSMALMNLGLCCVILGDNEQAKLTYETTLRDIPDIYWLHCKWSRGLDEWTPLTQSADGVFFFGDIKSQNSVTRSRLDYVNKQ